MGVKQIHITPKMEFNSFNSFVQFCFTIYIKSFISFNDLVLLKVYIELAAREVEVSGEVNQINYQIQDIPFGYKLSHLACHNA